MIINTVCISSKKKSEFLGKFGIHGEIVYHSKSVINLSNVGQHVTVLSTAAFADELH